MYVHSIELEPARRILAVGGLLIDLRPIRDYLGRHIRGSISLLFEPGPGLGGRARDLLPLDFRLILLDDGASPLDDAADSLRGKGFDVPGYVEMGVASWPGRELATTPAVAIEDWNGYLLDVADPGTIAPEGAPMIPAERLWQRAGEVPTGRPVGILAGWGVRAASAVGILERSGFRDLSFVRTRPEGELPPMAGADVFRVGGPP